MLFTASTVGESPLLGDYNAKLIFLKCFAIPGGKVLCKWKISLLWTADLEGYVVAASGLNYQQITPHVWKENKVHSFLQQVFSNYCVLVHHVMKHLKVVKLDI